MLETKSLLKLLDRGFLLKAFFLVLLFSIVPIAEIFLIQYLGEFLGGYFILALAAATGLAGLFLSFYFINGIIIEIRSRVHDGVYPARLMMEFVGAITGGLLLLCPGFITDLLGIMCFFPFFRSAFGRLLTRNMGDRLREVYEYLRLYE